MATPGQAQAMAISTAAPHCSLAGAVAGWCCCTHLAPGSMLGPDHQVWQRDSCGSVTVLRVMQGCPPLGVIALLVARVGSYRLT